MWSLLLDHMSAVALWDALRQRTAQILQESNTEPSMVITNQVSFSYSQLTQSTLKSQNVPLLSDNQQCYTLLFFNRLREG